MNRDKRDLHVKVAYVETEVLYMYELLPLPTGVRANLLCNLHIVGPQEVNFIKLIYYCSLR